MLIYVHMKTKVSLNVEANNNFFKFCCDYERNSIAHCSYMKISGIYSHMNSNQLDIPIWPNRQVIIICVAISMHAHL